MVIMWIYAGWLLWLSLLAGGLRWSESGSGPSPSTTTLKAVDRDIIVDVSYEIQVAVIRDVPQWNHSLTIHCLVEGLLDDQEISYGFCKNEDACIVVEDLKDVFGITLFDLDGAARTKFSGKRGMKVFLKIPNKYVDISGRYFCTAISGRTTIRSNFVEVRDTYFWERKIFTKVESTYKTGITTIHTGNLPFVLNCSDGNSVVNPSMPRWSKIQFRAMASWSVCPVLKNYRQLQPLDVMSPDKCLAFTEARCDNKISERICPRNLHMMSDWKYLQTERGDLIFTGVPPHSANLGETYALMCYTKDAEGDIQALSFFLNKKNDVNIEVGIAIKKSQSTFARKVEPISATVQYVTIYARAGPPDHSLPPVAIYTLYKFSEGSTFQWRFRGARLSSNNLVTVDRFSVVFVGAISSDLTGTYTLEVDDQLGNLTMVVHVTVRGLPVPVLSGCLPRVFYAWDADNFTLSCRYRNGPRIMTLRINSQEIHFNDSLENSQAQLKISYPNLSDLSFRTSLETSIDHTDVATMSYSLFHPGRAPDRIQNHDHIVTFIASNDFGMSLKAVTVYILPKLRNLVEHFPNQGNCSTSCSSTESRKFRCQVRVEQYKNKELTVEHYWTVGNVRLEVANSVDNVYSPYFLVAADSKELTMLALKTNNDARDRFVKESLEETTVECHVDLRSSMGGVSQFFYQSSADKDLRDFMRLRLRFDPPMIRSASSFWVVGLVVAATTVLIGIILVVIHYARRGRGGPSWSVKYTSTNRMDPDVGALAKA